MEDIRDCPFCGNKLQQAFMFYCEEPEGFTPVVGVQCLDCMTRSGLSYTGAVAVKGWNARPVEDALINRIAALEAMVKSAYIEGFCDGTDDESPDSGWERSVTKKKLEE